MQNSEELINPSESHLELINTSTIRAILLQIFPQHGEIIQKIDDDSIVHIKDLWLSPQLDSQIPFPILLACREQTLINLKKYTHEFLLLTTHQMPLQLFLDSSDSIQMLCLENANLCIELLQTVNQNWGEIFKLPETLLENLLTCIHLKTAKPLTTMHCITIAQNIMHILQNKPQEKIQLILSQGDVIQLFCEKKQLDFESFLNLPTPFITHIVNNQNHWDIFFKYLPFETWPQTSPVSEKVLGNLTYLLHPNCQLLKTHQESIPLHILLNGGKEHIIMIMANLDKVVEKMTEFGWTLEQLLNLEQKKLELFISYKPKKLDFIDENSNTSKFNQQFLFPSIFRYLSLNTLSIIFQYPESTSILFGQLSQFLISPVLTLDDLEPTILKFKQLPSIYHARLQQLQSQLVSAQSFQLIMELDEKIKNIQEKIQVLNNYPNLSEILFIEASTIRSLHFIKINIKELLTSYPLLVLDFLKHYEDILRLSNPKVNINQEILISLPEDKRKLFLQYSEQIVALIIEQHCQRDDLLTSSNEDILSRFKHLAQ